MNITFDDINRDISLVYKIKLRLNHLYYHATSSVYINSISKEGICRRSMTGTKTVYYGQLKPELVEREVEDAIFISAYPEISWAEHVCEKYGGNSVYFILSGKDIINAGCVAYPDYGMLQPVDIRGRVLVHDVKDIMLLGCSCVKVEKYKTFSKRR